MGFRSRTGSNASRGSRGSHEFGDISMRRNYSSIMPVRENVALRLRSESLLQIEDRLDDILDQFCYTDSQLVKFQKIVEQDIKTELEKDFDNRQRMLPTHVIKLPDGTEVGDYIVLDFGGKFFRAAYVNIKKAERISTTSDIIEGAREIPRRQRRQTLRPSESSSLSNSLKLVDMVAQVGEHEDEIGERVFMESAVYPMSKKILDSPAEKLFGHISKLCASFVKRFKLEDQNLPVILVNSFPCRHESLQNAHLIRWTKGVKSEGVTGKNISELLQQSLNEVGLTKLTVRYIVNDSVACLFTGLSEHPNTQIGLIIGTGFNISFLKPRGDGNPDVVNSELGSLGEHGELKEFLTDYDIQLQKSDHCHYKNQQVFEKMLTARYVPELFRIICKDLTDEGLLFNGFGSEFLEEPGKLPSDFLSQLVKAGDEGLNQVQDVLFNVDISAMYADADAVVRIAKALMTRSAALIAAALAGVIDAISHSESFHKHSIGISADGTTWKSYPKMTEFIQTMTQDMVGHDTELQFRTSFDGSSKGAAFIAAKHPF